MSQADLLQRAIDKAGTAAEIGRLTGRTPSRVSLWRSGKEPIPEDVLAYLAAYLGEDPIKVLAQERGGTWKRVANALKEKVSSGFETLLLYVKARHYCTTAR
jgi:transcriptional regulator with XRE-family HTH domain